VQSLGNCDARQLKYQNWKAIGAFKAAIFCFIFKSIFILILGFGVVNPSYIPFLIGSKISYELVPKLTLWDKN
jgi:hypothetical protein